MRTFTLVKDFFKIGFVLFFTAYMFILSCSFTISHVYCSKGEQWVMGSEMPLQKHTSKTNKCSYSTKKCHKAGNENNNKRKKDTFEIKFEFEGKNISSHETSYNSYISVYHHPINNNKFNLLHGDSTKKELLRTHSPPNTNSPDLSQLQVFRI